MARGDRERQFRRLYEQSGLDVLRFVRRRCGPDLADDVVAEAFLIVWRRLEDLPSNPEDRRAWLFGVARGCLANALRSARRQEALAVRIAGVQDRFALSGDPVDVLFELDLSRAWQNLSALHQETLALTAWDGLTSEQAARVLGISATAYRARLSRARRALRSRLRSMGAPGAPRSSTLLVEGN